MSMTAVRLLPFEILPGPLNMAADEVMLEWAVAGTASIRFYGWSEPTVSLGYFQKFSAKQSDPLLSQIAAVRRSTGGGAIVHHHELTYCLGIPSNLVGEEPWGCKMHHLITDVLYKFSVSSNSVVCGEEIKTDPFLCFHHHTAGDLAIGPSSHGRQKIVGSAQRKQHGAIVQHGSILLAQSPFAPTLPGILELSGVSIDPKILAERIQNQLSQTMNWEFRPSSWSHEELTHRNNLANTKYGNREWTEKR